MGYQVLARKWRPSRLDEVVGQDHVVRAVTGAIQSGRIPHAFLFSGPRGVGKTTMARLLAKALNCAKGPSAEPCQACVPCKEIPTGASVDVLEIDGASHTGVDDVRQIIEAVQYAPASARYKVYIIDEVHMLSLSAFNALLKTLEEPPPRVVFVFATTNPQKIPPTILGRCQKFEFWRIPQSLIVSKLGRIVEAEKLPVGPDALGALAQFSEGSLRDAEVLLDQVIHFTDRGGPRAGGKAKEGTGAKALTAQDVERFLGRPSRERLGALVDALIGHEPKEAMNILHGLYLEGHDLKGLSWALLQEVHAGLICLMTKNEAGRILQRSEEEVAGWNRRLAAASQADLVQMAEVLIQMSAALSQADDPYVVVTTYLSKITLLPRLMDMAQVFAKLEGAGGGSRGYSTTEASASPAGTSPTVTGSAHGFVEEPPRVPLARPAAAVQDADTTSKPASGTSESFVEYVASRNRMLGSFLRNAMVRREEGKILIMPGGEVESFSLDLMREKRPELRRWAGEHFGGELDVEIRAGGTPPISEPRIEGIGSGPLPAGPIPENGDPIENHPMYKEFVRVFQPERK